MGVKLVEVGRVARAIPVACIAQRGGKRIALRGERGRLPASRRLALPSASRAQLDPQVNAVAAAADAPQLVDAFTREALAIDVDQGIKGEQVVATMTRISSIRGAPKTIRLTMDWSSSRRHSTAGHMRTA